MCSQTQVIDNNSKINNIRFETSNGIIDAEVRELELEVTSLRKRRYILEKALVQAHKEIARLQKELRAYEGAR